MGAWPLKVAYFFRIPIVPCEFPYRLLVLDFDLVLDLDFDLDQVAAKAAELPGLTRPPLQGSTQGGRHPRAPLMPAFAARLLRPGLTWNRPFRPVFDFFPPSPRTRGWIHAPLRNLRLWRAMSPPLGAQVFPFGWFRRALGRASSAGVKPRSGVRIQPRVSSATDGVGLNNL